jgi:hypothetical protein
MSASKQKRARAKSVLRKLLLRADYQATALLTIIFDAPFWFFEQRRSLLADQLENEGLWR